MRPSPRSAIFRAFLRSPFARAARALGGACVLLGLAVALRAQTTLYFDLNSTTAGSGVAASGSYTWDAATAQWNTDSTGAAAGTISGWAGTLDTTVFSAGADGATSAYTVNVSGTQTLGGLTVNSGLVTLTGGTLALGQASTFNIGSATTISSAISGDFGLAKAGTGTLTLAGANTYAGATTVSAGTLQLAGTGTLGASANYTGAVSLASGAVFDHAATIDQTLSGAFSGAGNLLKSGTGTLTLTYASNQDTNLNGFVGTTTISAGTLSLDNPQQGFHFFWRSKTNIAGGAVLRLDGGGSSLGGGGKISMSEDISGGGDIIVDSPISSWADDRFTNVVSFQATGSTNTGTVTVLNSGYVVLERAGALGSTVDFILNGTNTKLGTYNSSGGSQTYSIGGLSGTGTVNVWGSPGSQTSTLSVGNGNETSTFSGTLQNTADTTKLALQKAGTGTLTLAGLGTYSGATTVSAGTLVVAAAAGHSAIGTGTLTVQHGASFAGSGDIAASFSTIHGTLLPGDGAVGKMTFAHDLTLASDSLLQLDLASAASYDQLAVNGTLTLGGALTVNLLGGYTPLTGASFHLFDSPTASSGSFSSFNLGTLGAGLAWDTSALYTLGDLSVSGIPVPYVPSGSPISPVSPMAAAVPEPETYALWAGLAGLGVVIFRRRRAA